MTDLSGLLAASKDLTSHLYKQELPSVTLSLDQIEAQSRRLVSRQPTTSNDTDRANYMLAQARVDAPSLTDSIAHLNTASTFSPFQPIQDTDVSGFLQHAHEQSLISTIEETRRETQEEFYRMLEDRTQREWELKKKRVFEELGGRSGVENRALTDLKKSQHGRSGLLASTSSPSAAMQTSERMSAYTNAMTALNDARLRGVSYSIIHDLIRVAESQSAPQIAAMFQILAKITAEPAALPSVTQIVSQPVFANKYAHTYLRKDSTTPEYVNLRIQIADGARQALEEQYWNVIDQTLQSRAHEARMGGDPSIGNRILSFLRVRYYSGGAWNDRIQLLKGAPVWAKLFFFVRTGHAEEAIEEARAYQTVIDRHEKGFVAFFTRWLETADRRLPFNVRTELQNTYNQHMLNAATADPFKLALYKLMGRIEPHKRNAPFVTITTEDWLWFQLAMVDEREGDSLSTFANTLLSYGESKFEGTSGPRQGIWASVLLMSGQFERAVAALWDHPETEVEAVHLAIALAYHGLLRVPSRAETSDMTPLCLPPSGHASISLPNIIARYIRQLVRTEPATALQYVYAISLTADQPVVGKEQLERAWEMIQEIIVHSQTGAAWDNLVGGFRADGSRFSGIIEQGLPLLRLHDVKHYNDKILVSAAKASEEADRIPEAIKLYNLAGEYSTVMACLAVGLGSAIQKPHMDDKAIALENVARQMMRNYERSNRAVGRDKDAVAKLLFIRDALNASEQGLHQDALNAIAKTELVPLDDEVGKATRRAEEFRHLHESLQRTLPIYVRVAMDAISGLHKATKNGSMPDVQRQQNLRDLSAKARGIMSFTGMIKFRMSPDIYSYIAKIQVEVSLY
ncbi:nucleoporin-interacting protein NIC96 [Cylindrobasidium torrendii FP15055 ss-10]|uniref:Nuclear pore protein n=1 Tax=Cylindrobasidium torrendii FP15055 ss-10 TaxID=1314674 RepID=A0A0D7B752_9AGAR|nr:nucleoporin-interacting protein NIC96 [Cylindrobasidium torrendii FP15055 ss-10]